MAVDSSQLLYVCPFCEKPFRDESKCRDHITESKSNGHSGVNGHTMDRLLDIRLPKIESVDAGRWKRRVLDVLENDSSGVDFDPDIGDVPYKEVAEATGLPESYVAWVLRQEGYQPVKSNGIVEGRMPTTWDDVSDQMQETLLAHAYYPELTHNELADSGLAGHSHQGSISRTIRDHSWMLGHPEIDTPIEPVEGEELEEGEVVVDTDTEELLGSMSRVIPGDDGEPGPVEKAAGDGAEALSSTDDPRGKTPEEPAPAEPAEPESELPRKEPGGVFIEAELSFEVVAALIETNRYEEARVLFDRATGAEPVDLRWEDGHEG